MIDRSGMSINPALVTRQYHATHARSNEHRWPVLASYSIRLLGSLRVESEGRVITRFRTRQTGALLAFLAYYRERAHPRDALVDRLWPEDTQDAGRHKLRLALSSLRHQLEPPGTPAGAVIIADRTAVQLNPAAVTTDVARFEAALHAARQSRSAIDRARWLSEALELYHAELLPGCFDSWMVPERLRLAECSFQALAELIALAEEQGNLARALQWARRAVAADPLREESQHDLIRLLIAAGQPDAARRQYDELEQRLTQELGVEPAEATLQLIREIGTVESPPSHAAARGRGGEGAMRRPDTEDRSIVLSPPRPVSLLRLSGGVVALLLVGIELAHPPSPAAGSPSAAAIVCTRLLRVFEHYSGHVGQVDSSTLLAAFSRPSDALAAAVAGQKALTETSGDEAEAPSAAAFSDGPEPSADSLPLARMALHAGEVEIESGRYQGLVLDQAARVLLAAHPGQILCTEAAMVLFRGSAEPGKPGIQFLDLGSYRLWDTDSGINAPERLFQALAPGALRREFPPPLASLAHAAHLPLQLSRFFGREREIADLLDLLGSMRAGNLEGGISAVGRPAPEPIQNPNAQTRGPAPRCAPPPEIQNRLITLTGPGGSGKTRLAVEVARRLGAPFFGAVWFVPLADLSHADLIPKALLDALRLPRLPEREPLDQVRDALASHRCLLVLDNFEHLVEAGAAFVQALLQRIPSLTCLVTSRQVLNLAGERELPVSTLPVPDEEGKGRVESAMRSHPSDRSDPSEPSELAPLNPQLSTLAASPSVQLFADRAQAVRPDFQITLRNAGAVAELCRRLEGIPLAVELAAAWSRMLSPAQMLAQLEGRFDFLVSRKRDRPSRHLTLRAALAWSYDLLAPSQQQFFAQLSVFRGGWTLAAAAAVCQEPRTMEYMSCLLEGSLAVVEGTDLRSPAFGAGSDATQPETLDDESPEAAIRFRMLETLREFGAEQLSPEERAAAERRHLEFYLALAEQAEPELTGPDQLAWLDRLQSEHDNLRAALARALRDRYPAEGLRLAAALGKFWETQGYLAEGRKWLADLFSLDPSSTALALRARALGVAGVLARDQGESATGRQLLEEAAGSWRTVGNRAELAKTLYQLGCLIEMQNIGDSVRSRSDWPAARALLEESLAIWRELGHTEGVASALSQLGHLAVTEGANALARSLCTESLGLWRQAGDKRGLAIALNSLGLAARAQRDYAAASQALTESLALCRELGDRRGINIGLHNLGDVASDQGNYAEAMALEEQALALSRALGHRFWVAANLYVIGNLALKLRQPQRADACFQESLAVLREESNEPHRAACFQGMARVAAAEGAWNRATRLFAAAARLRQTLDVDLSPDDRADHDRDLAAARAGLGEAGFGRAWAAGAGMTVEQATIFALHPGPAIQDLSPP